MHLLALQLEMLEDMDRDTRVISGMYVTTKFQSIGVSRYTTLHKLAQAIPEACEVGTFEPK